MRGEGCYGVESSPWRSRNLVGTWGGVLWGGLSLEEQELSRCVGRGVMGWVESSGWSPGAETSRCVGRGGGGGGGGWRPLPGGAGT